ncbi:type II secretion system F family protein [Specibacter cremeus]|uniref:type II secretion system F family protein n=1 Tax=Specibacter cremeus TaxID=1629051 RepID=UPI001F0C75DB|nr:hypothetical protein [Specibacter cremeus]
MGVETAVFLLAAAAAWLLAGSTRPWMTRRGRTAGRRRPPRTAAADEAGAGMVRLVRQLAALLAAGRSGPRLWEDLATVLEGADPCSPHAPVVRAVERVTGMGLSAGDAIRATCAVSTPGGAAAHRSDLVAWRSLAACLDVSAASGAPLAAVLTRFAASLESDMDAAAQRRTALAGPRATVRLLTWLPVLGLALGMAMGVDPVRVLTSTPVGWAAAAAGLTLMLLGRWWSTRLIVSAAGSRS